MMTFDFFYRLENFYSVKNKCCYSSTWGYIFYNQTVKAFIHIFFGRCSLIKVTVSTHYENLFARTIALKRMGERKNAQCIYFYNSNSCIPNEFSNIS